MLEQTAVKTLQMFLYASLITSCISFHISSMFCGPDLIKNVRGYLLLVFSETLGQPDTSARPVSVMFYSCYEPVPFVFALVTCPSGAALSSKWMLYFSVQMEMKILQECVLLSGSKLSSHS